MHSTAASLVDHILPQAKVRQWVLSFPFRLRYLQAYDGQVLSSILRIYFRVIRNFYRSQLKGFEREVGAVTFIQRFGGSLNLNVHFHTLFLEGCYIKDHTGSIHWRELRAPSTDQVHKLNQLISKRVQRFLTRHGYLEEFEEGNFQLIDDSTDPVKNQYESSIIKKGEKIGQTHHLVWTIPTGRRLSYLGGFSLHANVSVSAKNRDFLEKLCRYMGRGAITDSRLSRDFQGNILYKLKNHYNDGTTHLKFTPSEFIKKLIALIPPPKSHLIRYHGVLAPNSKWRKSVISRESFKTIEKHEPRKYWIPWAQLLARVHYDHLSKCVK